MGAVGTTIDGVLVTTADLVAVGVLLRVDVLDGVFVRVRVFVRLDVMVLVLVRVFEMVGVRVGFTPSRSMMGSALPIVPLV